MSPWVIFLIQEATKLAIQRIEALGKLGTLTEDEAKAMAQSIADSLSSVLPTPEELEDEPPPTAA